MDDTGNNEEKTPEEGQKIPEDQKAPESEKAPEGEQEPFRPARLYKSRTNRILFGVCGGLGEYFKIDPVMIRLIFILSFLLGGWGMLVYLASALLIPNNPAQTNYSEAKTINTRSENGKILIGSAFILLGLFALLRTTGILHYFRFFGIAHEIIIPLVLVGLGILVIMRHADASPKRNIQGRKKLYRSSSDRMIAGVCAGLGEYLDVDPVLVRVAWVILTFGSFGIGILIYILFALLVPLNNGVNLEK